MLKTRIFQVLLVVICSLILVGVFFGLFAVFNSNESIKIKISSGETKSIDCEELYLVPGESKEYYIDLRNDVSGECKLEFKFEELEPSPLKDYVNVVLIANDTVVYNAPLNTLLAPGQKIMHIGTFQRNKEFPIIVKYYMPIEVTNEAQGKTADLKFSIYATNE